MFQFFFMKFRGENNREKYIFDKYIVYLLQGNADLLVVVYEK